jgi:hypothetical protein
MSVGFIAENKGSGFLKDGCGWWQGIKAALDSAIAAFARLPDLAGPLWERLAQAVVVQPLTSEDNIFAPVSRYDITYQLNEIQAGPLFISAVLLHHLSTGIHANET